MADLNNIKRSLVDYISSEAGITEERVIELIEAELLNTIGDMSNLQTEAKDLIVNAINELVNSGVDNSKLEELEDRIDEVFQLGNDVKQMLVDALIANGLTEENLSTSNTFESLINYIDWFDYYKGYNIYKFVVPANTTLELIDDLRGDPFNETVYTDWGDGTIDANLTHTYATAGTYIVISKYSLSTYGENSVSYDPYTVMYLTDVMNINCKITDANYMYVNCNALTNINANEWDTSNIETMNYMFSGCRNLETLINDKWNISNVVSAVGITNDCIKLN